MNAAPETFSRAWFPCENPERPNDAWMVWHRDCHGCFTAAVATQRRLENDDNVEPIVTQTVGSLVRQTKPRAPIALAEFLRPLPHKGSEGGEK